MKKRNKLVEIAEIQLVPETHFVSLEKNRQKFIASLSKKYKLGENQKFVITTIVDEKTGDIVLRACSTKYDGTILNTDLFFDLKT